MPSTRKNMTFEVKRKAASKKATPKQKHSPTQDPVDGRPATTEEVTVAALTSIRHLPVADQNKVVKTIVKEIGIDRKRSYDALRETSANAGHYLDEFIQANPSITKVYDELDSNKTNS